MVHQSAILTCVIAAVLGSSAFSAVWAQQQPPAQRDARVFEHVVTKAGLPVVKVMPGALVKAKGSKAGVVAGVNASFVIERFPLTGGDAPTFVDLRLQEFSITTPQTRFVRGQLNGPDIPLDFDPSSITFLRGTVVGYPASHVFMAISDAGSTARIDLGSGHQRYLLSSRGSSSVPLEPGEMVVFPAVDQPQSLPGVPMCGVVPSRFGDLVVDRVATQLDGPVSPAGPGGGKEARPAQTPGADGTPEKPAPQPRGADNVRGLQQLQLAVETDYELFELFGDVNATAMYVAQLYAAVSDIYIRDVNTRVVLTFLRVWNTPLDMFNQPEPLEPFASFWNQNMQAVQRDAAQFLTGRRNLSAGGVAYSPALCSNGYSWSGYTLGFFGDPDNPSWTNRDIIITAHELGHNCGTLHSHDYGLDSCQLETSQPQRGSIMSYCGQTYSGVMRTTTSGSMSTRPSSCGITFSRARASSMTAMPTTSRMQPTSRSVRAPM